LHPFAEMQSELVHCLSPVLNWHSPFFRDVSQCQEQQFQHSFIRWEGSPVFDNLPETHIERFNGVSRINRFSDIAGIRKIGNDFCPVAFP